MKSILIEDFNNKLNSERNQTFFSFACPSSYFQLAAEISLFIHYQDILFTET